MSATALSNVQAVPRPAPSRGPVARPPRWGLITRILADDLESAAVQMRNWSSIEYTRLDKKPANMTGLILGLGQTLVGKWGGTCAKIVHTAVPDGSIAMLLATAGVGRYGTTALEPGSCLIGTAGADPTYFTNHEFRGILIATSQANWQSFMDACGFEFPMRRAQVLPIIAPGGTTETLAALVRAAAHCAEAAPDAFAMSAPRAELEQEILATISRVMGMWPEDSEKPSQPSVARHRAAVRAREYIDAHLDHPLSLAGVCRASFSSARALEYAFRELFGVTPMAYARFARLSRVRRELLNEDFPSASVTDTATRWGFWHLGQFSKDYQSLFGELPSVTLARAKA